MWDNLSPFGNPGGLAMTGKVRNWARLINGKPKFNKDARSETDFSPQERELVARAAGRVSRGAPVASGWSGRRVQAVAHGRYVTFRLTEVAVPRVLFQNLGPDC